MASAINTKYFDGSDCSGTSGDANRVLTLSNSQLTQDEGLLVFSSRVLVLDTDFTITHASASSTITFLINVYDDQNIVVNYYESVGAPTITGNNDFINGPLSDFGIDVTRTPVTVTLSNVDGGKTYTDGTDTTITVMIENANTKYSLDKSGLSEGADARILMKTTDTINKNDKITHNSITYRVDAVSERLFAVDSMYLVVLLYRI